MAASAASESVIIYPEPAGVKPSDDYRVTVNGRPVFVYQAPSAATASFEIAGKVRIVIETARDVKWVDIRPRRAGINAKLSDHKIEFMLDCPCSLSIELNGEFSRNPLFLFANPPERNIPARDDPNVRYFEGGKVHRPGFIELRSGQTVYIAGGAIVEGFIIATDANDVSVCGRGILVGSKNREGNGPRWRRFVGFEHCRNVHMEGLTLVDSTTWQIVPAYCDDVHISNVKIISDNGSDDGIDVVASRHVLIEECFIRTKDDCIAVKAFGDTDQELTVDRVSAERCVFWNATWGNALEIGFELRGTVSNVVFRDCDVIHVEDGAALSIHNGDHALVEDILFEDIRIEDARQKLIDVAIFLTQYSLDRPRDSEERARRYKHGAWDGVLTVTDNQMKDHTPHRGYIRNITFKDIHIVDGLTPFSILCGWDVTHCVENVVIENLYMHGRKVTSLKEGKFFVEHTQGIHFR